MGADYISSQTGHDMCMSFICDNSVATQNEWFSGETFKGFEVLYFSLSATTTQLLSSGEFCKLRYDTIPVKSASANVSFFTSNSKMPNFELWPSCCKWARYIYIYIYIYICLALVYISSVKTRTLTQLPDRKEFTRNESATDVDVWTFCCVMTLQDTSIPLTHYQWSSSVRT